MNRRGFLLGLSAFGAGVAALRPGEVRAAPKPVVGAPFRMVLDPGHGGENEGCVGHGEGVLEKHLTLVMAQALAARIVELMPRAEVLLTRERDETLHLSQRIGFANSVEADLFLSLHCNASPNSDQTGFETFLLDLEASTSDAALTAQRENDEGLARPADGRDDEVSVMLRELGMSTDRKHAAHFATMIQREQAARFPTRPDRGVRSAAFDVLMGARMPAVLHEVGFLDHAEESRLLLDAGGRGQIVEALAQATWSYYTEVARRA
jgi:N-acetylmuramoyl-L-alanine amidase